MSRRNRAPAPADAPLNGPDVPVEDKQRQLEGRRPADQQGEAFIDVSDTDDLGQLTHTAIYQGEIEAGVDDNLPTDPENLELLIERELRDGETDDVAEAIEEGMTYIPPTDPPIIPGGEGDLDDAEVAAGFSVSSLEEPYNQDNQSSFYPDDDEMTARVRAALRADSSTSHYGKSVRITTRNGIVTLRGVVDDLDDTDNLMAVASFVEGVEEVIDELRVRSLE